MTIWLKNWPDNLKTNTGYWLIIDNASLFLSEFTAAYSRMHLLVSVYALVSGSASESDDDCFCYYKN